MVSNRRIKTENITIGQIAAFLGILVSVIGALEFLIARIKKTLDKALKPIIDDIKEEKISRIKADLVDYQALIDTGSINYAQKQNYFEEFDIYTKAGYNSYVHDEHERLKKEGKI